MKAFSAITRWTLWQRRWSTLWWLIGILAFVALVLIFYPSISHQAEQLNKSLSNQIPTSARSFISDTQNLFSPIGYLSSQLYYLMLPILLSILTIGLGSSLIAREEKDQTIELLLARPISRAKLLASKVAAGVLIVLALATVSFVATALMAAVVKLHVSTLALAVTTLACTLLALAFGAIAFMITMFGRARAASIGISVAIALGGYIINSLAATTTVLKWPSKLLPFHYYHSADILNGSYHLSDLLVFISIIVVCGVISWAAFRRRDIG